MHQTFYIDIDEEITSVVEKLKKTEAPEAVLVVPKGALLIQSIVNLKLLRKEADKLGLKISIVTQDKLGKMLIQKAGIFVEQKVEDDEEEIFEQQSLAKSKKGLEKNGENIKLDDYNRYDKRRLKKIGSADYFNSDEDGESFFDQEEDQAESVIAMEKKSVSEIKARENKKIINSANSKINQREESVAKKRISMDVARPVMPNASKKGAPPFSDSRGSFTEIPFSVNNSNYSKINQQRMPTQKKESPRDQQLEDFFYANNFSNKDMEKQLAKGEKGNNKLFRIVLILLAILLVGGGAYGAYLYVPKATVTILAKKEIKSADMEIAGDISYDSIDYEKKTIPAKQLEFDEEVVKTFMTTGEKNVSNQKAKGKITIYNEFSSTPQPLVATTRFLSEDQKVFRLVQSVTIPGTTKVDNEIKPGVIEAEVIADESGDGYNIPATNFSIPGFKDSGGDKATKIYAKSSVAMSGGGNGNDSVKIVSEKDISDAKDKISLEITDTVKQKIKDSADSGTVVLTEAITIDEPVYRLSNSAGEATDNFEIKVQAHAQALVFFESDVKKLANFIISKSGSGKIDLDTGSVVIDYGKPLADFKLGKIDIKMHASNVMQPKLDLEILKKGFLGKNNNELTEYLKTYPDITNAEVEYWPAIVVNKIPSNEKRVEVIINATMP